VQLVNMPPPANFLAEIEKGTTLKKVSLKAPSMEKPFAPLPCLGPQATSRKNSVNDASKVPAGGGGGFLDELRQKQLVPVRKNSFSTIARGADSERVVNRIRRPPPTPTRGASGLSKLGNMNCSANKIHLPISTSIPTQPAEDYGDETCNETEEDDRFEEEPERLHTPSQDRMEHFRKRMEDRPASEMGMLDTKEMQLFAFMKYIETTGVLVQPAVFQDGSAEKAKEIMFSLSMLSREARDDMPRIFGSYEPQDLIQAFKIFLKDVPLAQIPFALHEQILRIVGRGVNADTNFNLKAVIKEITSTRCKLLGKIFFFLSEFSGVPSHQLGYSFGPALIPIQVDFNSPGAIDKLKMANVATCLLIENAREIFGEYDVAPASYCGDFSETTMQKVLVRQASSSSSTTALKTSNTIQQKPLPPPLPVAGPMKKHACRLNPRENPIWNAAPPPIPPKPDCLASPNSKPKPPPIPARLALPPKPLDRSTFL